MATYGGQFTLTEGLSIHEAVWQLAWKKSGPEMASLEAWLEEHEKYRSVA
ncbi:traC domain protein [Escherichia coli]